MFIEVLKRPRNNARFFKTFFWLNVYAGSVIHITRHAFTRLLRQSRRAAIFFSYLADISVGGALPLRDWSVLIIRTKGEAFVDFAKKKGAIITRAIEFEPKVLPRLLRLSKLGETAKMIINLQNVIYQWSII